jgi:hypothetical protein
MLTVIMQRVVMLSVIMQSVVMLSVVMLSVVMLSVMVLSVIMLCVIMLNVVAPIKPFFPVKIPFVQFRLKGNQGLDSTRFLRT